MYSGRDQWLRERRVDAGSPSAWSGRLAVRLRGPVRSRCSKTLRDVCLAVGALFPEGM